MRNEMVQDPSNLPMERAASQDNGLELALRLADEQLEQVESFLNDRADADYDDDAQRAVGNPEMYELMRIQDVRATLARIVRRIAK